MLIIFPYPAEMLQPRLQLPRKFRKVFEGVSTWGGVPLDFQIDSVSQTNFAQMILLVESISWPRVI